jgi:hypothetical protein
MLYRLTFNITRDGYLRVAGSAKGTPLVSAIHLNEEVLAVAVKTAQIAPFQTLRILEAARDARKQPEIDVYCEAVEISQRQIDVLCLQRA